MLLLVHGLSLCECSVGYYVCAKIVSLNFSFCCGAVLEITSINVAMIGNIAPVR